MKAGSEHSASSKKLRLRAEKMLRKAPREVVRTPVDDVQKLVHELQVHQVELEMQNDELRRKEQALEASLDRYTELYMFSPVAQMTLNANGEILEANLNAGTLLGLERGKLIHQKLSHFVHAEAQDTFYLYRLQVFRSPARQSTELDLVSAQAKRLVVHVEAMHDAPHLRHQRGFSFTDITGRKQAEVRIARLNRIQAILGDVDHAIVHGADQQTLLDEICRVAVEKGDFKLAWIAMVSPDGSVQPVAKAGEIAYLDGIGVLIRDDEPEGRGPVGTAIREKRPVVIENIDQDPRMAPWRKRAQQFGLHYVAAFPLTIAGKVAGSFQVYAPRAGFFDENELSLLTQVSADISFALEARINLAARNQAEVELRTSERKLRTLSQAVEQSPAIVLITSPTGEIDYVNPKFTEVTGYSLEETLGKNPRLLKSGHQSPGFYKELWETITAGREWRGELCNRKKNGEVYWEFAVIAPIKDEYGTIAHFVALNEDITERKRLEQDVIEISGHELNRIGQELHDDICQCLAGTAVLAGVLAKGIAKESPGNAAKAQEISDYTRHTLDALRMLARGLTPAVIQSEGGLAGALFKLAANVEELFHIRCRCDFTSTVDARDETAALHLYRIAQEAISNAVRHGGAHEVGILLQSHKGRISMLIRDDGCGIPQPLPQTPGMGLRTMRYRAGIIGATLEIRPGAGGGTEIVCTLPKEL